MAPEKRCHPRVRLAGRFGDVEYKIEDLSETGLFLCTEHREPMGERLQLDLAIEDWDKGLHLVGTVIRHDDRSDRSGMALAFENLDDRSRVWLKELIEDLESGRSRYPSRSVRRLRRGRPPQPDGR